MADVFISYKAEEFNEASWVKSTLETNGISCWMAPMSIPGGSSYAVEIPQAIKAAKVFVLILSEQCQQSRWVPRELDQAINEGKTVLPFMLENCPLKDDFNFYLSNVQRYDAYESKSAAIEKMIIEIRAILESKGQTGGDSQDEEQKKVIVNAPEEVRKQAPAEKKKFNRLFWIIPAAVLIIALIVVLVILLPKGGNNTTNDQTAPAGSQAADAEASDGPEEIVMSDELSDYTFELEGVVYKLPFGFEALSENGWTIISSGYTSDSMIGGNGYEVVSMAKDGRKISAYVYNKSGNAKPIKECKVGGVECDGQRNDVSFTIAKGITLSSTPEEIRTAFGIPGYTASGEGYESLSYYSSSDQSSNNRVRFYYSSEYDYLSIEMRNVVETEDDKTETSTERPEYLDTYKAPASRGSDLTSAVVEIEGDLYQLPAPITEFVDNGWSITQQPGDLVAGGTGTARIEKDGHTLDISVINFTVYQTTIENCAVYKFYTDVDYNYPDVSIGSADKPIKLGSSKEDVEAAISDEFSLYEGSYSFSYDYYEYKERDFSVGIDVDVETKTVSEISVSCKTWDY